MSTYRGRTGSGSTSAIRGSTAAARVGTCWSEGLVHPAVAGVVRRQCPRRAGTPWLRLHHRRRPL